MQCLDFPSLVGTPMWGNRGELAAVWELAMTEIKEGGKIPRKLNTSKEIVKASSNVSTNEGPVCKYLKKKS